MKLEKKHLFKCLLFSSLKTVTNLSTIQNAKDQDRPIENTNFPIVFYGYKTYALTEECKLKVSENKVENILT
jgi:hypothetical protein